uniref:Zgc:85722 n=1 Tax=Astyanax mexicanus TaxID=7994 RepID=A0A8B9K8E2_ASTMX
MSFKSLIFSIAVYTEILNIKKKQLCSSKDRVIYALNTKNDEHEEAIQSLKEAHEDEVQHILSETRDKILQYKSKMGDEAELKRRLQSLEESVELHEHMKRQALAEFQMYRQRMEDSQLCAEAQHTQRVVSMSREVEEMRHDFEEKLRSFSQVQAQFEQEKLRNMEDLKLAHRQELQELLETQQSQSASSCLDQEKLAELHRAELEALMERVEELTQDKVRLVEEYETKLGKAQAFYERELEAMRRAQQLTTENLLAWKRTEVELRKEFQVQEAALQRTLCKLRSELQRAQEQARETRDKTNRLQASLNNAEVTIKELHKQLEEAIQDGEIWVMQLKDTEYELEGSRDRVQQQATEILHKASHIGSLQATQMSHEATIRDLHLEQSRLKDKIVQLEEEKERLQSQSQALDEQQRQQIISLEKVGGFLSVLSAHFSYCHYFNFLKVLADNKPTSQLPIVCEPCIPGLSALFLTLRPQEEIESQKQQHEARIIAVKAEEKQKMDKITEELDNKWTDALRYAELKSLKEELTDEHEADKQAVLTQLSQQRDLELMAARESWQRKVEDLLEQVGVYTPPLLLMQCDFYLLECFQTCYWFPGSRSVAHEQDLSKRHEREMGEMNASHNRETHIMLSDFNKAQELLKDKISALQILLEGTEEKFRNRESRPEDLQTIAELREMVAERESLVKKLVDDKKFYQLELVNRETSFNKVFNTSPNVGVINPLIKVIALL